MNESIGVPARWFGVGHTPVESSARGKYPMDGNFDNPIICGLDLVLSVPSVAAMDNRCSAENLFLCAMRNVLFARVYLGKSTHHVLFQAGL